MAGWCQPRTCRDCSASIAQRHSGGQTPQAVCQCRCFVHKVVADGSLTLLMSVRTYDLRHLKLRGRQAAHDLAQRSLFLPGAGKRKPVR